jgi:hypothetical protein
MTPAKPPKELKYLRLNRVIWPTLLSVAAVGFLTYRDISSGGWEAISTFEWTGHILLFIFLAFTMSAIRDLGYIWRLKMLSEDKLSWRAAFEVTFLWEFSSAITPSVVGGSAVAIFMLIKEKISAGKSTAMVFVTILLDELFYVLILPISILLVGNYDYLFNVTEYLGSGNGFFGAILTAFWVGYSIIVLYVGFLIFALFIRPEWSNYAIKRLFRLRILRRWARTGIRLANELLASSLEYRKRGPMFWLKLFFATCLAWMGRYLVLNCLTFGFGDPSFFDQLVVFSRQAILFLLMIISPTPGSSGVAEVVFPTLFGQFIPEGMSTVVVLIWRLATYFLYLFMGLIVIPRWVKRTFGSKTGKDSPTVPESTVAEPTR